MQANHRCKDCGRGSKRPAPHPGPRCSTHHREVLKERRERAHGKRVEAIYGLTSEEYWKLYEFQGGTCAICQRAKGTGRRKLAVDHDHETGEVRQLLCAACNRGVLGHLRDDPAALRRAADSIENPPARKVIGKCFVPLADVSGKRSTGQVDGARRTITDGGATGTSKR